MFCAIFFWKIHLKPYQKTVKYVLKHIKRRKYKKNAKQIPKTQKNTKNKKKTSVLSEKWPCFPGVSFFLCVCVCVFFLCVCVCFICYCLFVFLSFLSFFKILAFLIVFLVSLFSAIRELPTPLRTIHAELSQRHSCRRNSLKNKSAPWNPAAHSQKCVLQTSRMRMLYCVEFLKD